MRQLALLLLLHYTLAQFFDQEKCLIDNRSFQDMWEAKLMFEIVNCSEPFRPPAQNSSEPLRVYMNFFMKSFTYDEERQEFSALTWVMLSWVDRRFKWKPSKYDGLDKLLFSASRIWTPIIELINDVNEEFDQRYLFLPCEIDSIGYVSCMFQTVYKVKCNMVLRDWPYDVPNCTMEFGPYLDKELNTSILFDTGPKAMHIIEDGADWVIKDYQQTLDETSSDKQLVLKFKLQRHTKGLAAIVIYPSVVLSLLSLSSLLIDMRLEHRLLVSCFSLLCHFYFLTDLSWIFPDKVIDSPSIVLYYRGSFIMTSLLICVSFVLSSVCDKTAVCPDWIISVNDFVYMKVFVWPRWEARVEASEFVKDWTGFANIVNTITIYVSLIVYVSLYCVFMPQPN